MPRTLSKDEILAFRGKLCQTAEHLFIEYGVSGFTMRRLASALGVSAMTPYRYYHSKSALLAAVRAQAFSQLAQTLQHTYRDTENPDIRIYRLGQVYIDFALNQRDQYQLMFSPGSEKQEISPELTETYQDCLSWMVAGVHDAMGDDIPASVGAEKIALSLWSMLHGVIATAQILNIPEERRIRKLVTRATDYLLTGMKNPALDTCTAAAAK